MPKKATDTITVAKITLIGTITVAIISLLGNLVLGYWQFILKPGEPNQPTLTPNSNSLAIEQIPSYIVTYAATGAGLGGTASLRLSTGDSTPTYILSYELPTNTSGNAGLAFNFNSAQNVSQHKKIEFTIQFQAKDEKVDLYVKDILASDLVPSYRIVSTGSDKMNISIPLENFSGVNLNALKEVIFDVNSTFENGFQEIFVSNIRFVP